MSETPLNQDQNSDEIDLKDLIFPLWKARKQILTIATICGILGGILGFLTPATYNASSIFLPQTMQSGGSGSSLGGLAEYAGMNLNTPMAGGDIPPSMYSTVFESEPFRKRILDSKIWKDGDSITYRYYLENQPSSIIGTFKEYSFGLPSKIFALFSNKDERVKFDKMVKEIDSLSRTEYDLLNQISTKVSIVLKEELITISVVENNPIIAAQITKVVESVLQDWINEYKTNHAKIQFEFVEKQLNIKQMEFFSIQEQLSTFRDKNQNILSPAISNQIDRLQAKFNLANSLYTELANQKEQAAIQLSKVTPTFIILNPVKVPREKSGPNLKIYVFVSFFIGLTLSSGFFTLKKPIEKFFKELQTLN